MPLLNRTLNLAKKLSLYIFIAVIAAILSARPALAEGGYTWTKQNDIGQANWKAVASSADGSRLAALDFYEDVNSRYVYTSSDYGVTWVQNAASAVNGVWSTWASIDSSADGSHLIASTADSMMGGSIYTSEDYGVTWTYQPGAGNHVFYSVTSSADGSKLAAAAGQNNFIYTSTDYGVAWTARLDDTDRHWSSITSSADGTKLAAVNRSTKIGQGNYTNGDHIYTSTDSGVTWTEQQGTPLLKWSSITSSADGTKLAATDGYSTSNGGYLYTSTDSGVTWIEQTAIAIETWQSIASNADGSRLIVAGAGEDFDQEGTIQTAFNPSLVPTDPDPENPPITTTTPTEEPPEEATTPTTPISMVGDLLAATGANTLILLALSSILTVSGIAWAVWEERELAKDGAG
jgi:hypothetical protein